MAPTLTGNDSMPINATDAKRSDGGDPPVGEKHDKKTTAAPITPAGVQPKVEENLDILAGSEIRGVMMGAQEGSTGSGASFGLSGNAFGLDPLTETAFLTKLNEPQGGDDSTATEDENEAMKTFVTDYFNGMSPRHRNMHGSLWRGRSRSPHRQKQM